MSDHILKSRLRKGLTAADRELLAATEVWRDASERIAARWLRVADIVDATPDATLRTELYDRLMEVAAATDAKRRELGLSAPPLFRQILSRRPGAAGPIAASVTGGAVGVLALIGAFMTVRWAWGWAAPERKWEAEHNRSLDEIMAIVQQSPSLTARQARLIENLERDGGFLARHGRHAEDIARSTPHAGLKTWNAIRASWLVWLTVAGVVGLVWGRKLFHRKRD